MKYITKGMLIAANAEAIRLGFNQALYEEWLESLNEDGLFPVRLVSHHEDYDGNRCCRVIVTFDSFGQFGLLDLTTDTYVGLPDPPLLRKI